MGDFAGRPFCLVSCPKGGPSGSTAKDFLAAAQESRAFPLKDFQRTPHISPLKRQGIPTRGWHALGLALLLVGLFCARLTAQEEDRSLQTGFRSGASTDWLGTAPDASLNNLLGLAPGRIVLDTLATGVVQRRYDYSGQLLETRFLSFEQLRESQRRDRNHSLLRKDIQEESLGGGSSTGEHIQIDIPFKIRSQTFQRIFGSGRIGMNVTGQIGIRGAFRREKRESESASQFANNNSNFNLEQSQQFTVVGKIGEKVDVHIDQDTERTFDFENSLSITYTGEPEEVIQSLQVGNISLSLPSTRFVNFSERSSGLFGLKAVTRFGPLELTGVASSERNESKSQKARGDGSSESLTERNLGDWVKNIFFINSFYRDRYRMYTSGTMDHNYIEDARITRFTLFRFSAADDAERKELQLAHPEPGGPSPFEGGYLMIPQTWTPGTTEDLDFEIDPYRGIVRLNFRPSRNEFVAMAYSTSTPGLFDGQITLAQSGLTHGPFNQGVLTGNNGNTAANGDEVVVLVPQNMSPDTDPYWELQLKNVYRMNAQNAEDGDFSMRILQTRSGSTGNPSQGSDSYLSLFYLDTKNNATGIPGKDGKVDLDWLDTEKGELWFPVVEPFGADTTWNVALSDNPSGRTVLPNVVNSTTDSRYTPFEDAAEIDTLYSIRETAIDYLDLISKYTLESTAQVGTEVISLGWNVTNVSVTANGRRLTEGTDYELDEFAGIVRITNAQYTAPNQEIEVTYETPQLFQLRKKTYAGLSAKYDLGQNNFLGASMIYFNEESSERKIRLGNEPIKNLIFDVNGKIGFKPRLMTSLVDALPLVEADAESELNLEAEFAMVLPDPNPSNNGNTGDNNGVAYVDDFESSKQEIPMGLSHNQWFISSRPANGILGYRGQIGWWNPRDRVEARDIWKQFQQGDNQTAENNLRVFRIHYYPFTLESQVGTDTEIGPNGTPIERRDGWGGIYYDFRGAYDDLSDKKYLELTFRAYGDRSGTMHIDLGRVSEDVIPNGTLDTEDINNDNLLATSEDVGLDGAIGEDPPWPMPDELFGATGLSTELPYDFWDINFNGVKEPAEPWSYDNWVRSPTELTVLPDNDPAVDGFDRGHGWEGNRLNAEQNYPDTEDRNGNKSLDQEDAYYTYSIPLNPNHPEFPVYASPLDNDWYYVRIPLDPDEAERVGAPSLTLVNGVRLWFTGNVEPLTMDLVEFNVVGNEWREIQIADSDTSHYELTVLNNFDNRQDYYGPPGVQGQLDFLTNQVSREQSLVMQLEDMPFGQTAWARKQFATAASFTEYRKLRMFLHGGSFTRTAESGELPGVVDFVGEDKLEFIFRIQSSEGNYYEYSKFIEEGWAESNSVDIILREITGLETFSEARKQQEEPDKPILLSDGGQVRVVGSPSINQVRTLLFGVKNHDARPATTEVWFNELRVSDVKKENATAVRAEVDAKFSDFLRMDVNFEQQDAEFHNVKQRSSGTNQTFQRKRSFNGNTDLGRFLPPSWNTSIAVSGSWSHDFKLPKYFPNDDDEVDPDDHPEWVEDVSRRRNARIGFDKNESESLVGRVLVDKVSLSYDIAETVSRNKLVAGDTTVTQNFNVGFNSGNFNWKHRLQPLVFVPDWPLIGGLGEVELNYFPTNLNLTASARRTLRDKLDRDGTFLHTEQYTLDRNASTGWQLFSNLGFNISRQYQNNLLFDRRLTTVPEDDPTRESDDAFYEGYERWLEGSAGFFEGDHNISQPFSASFDPDLLDWLSTSFSYSSSYTWRRTLIEPARGVDVASRGDFSTRFRLQTPQVLQTMLFLDTEEMREIKNTHQERKAERAEERQRKKAERQERREERKAEKERKRQEKEARKNGEDGTVDGNDLLPPPPPPLEASREDMAGRDEGQEPVFSRMGESGSDSLDTEESLPAAALPDSVEARESAGPVIQEEPEEDKGPGILARGTRAVYHRLALLTEVLDDLSINFNRNNSFTNPGQAVYPWTSDWTDRHASLAYQLGLSRDTGIDTINVGNYTVQSQRTFGYDYRLNTQLKVIPRIPLDLSYEYEFSQSFTDERETIRSESENGWYDFDNEELLGKGTLGDGDVIGGNPALRAIPNYSFSIGGLEKLPLLKSAFNSVNMNHNYTGRLQTSYSASTSGGLFRSQLNFSRSFSPLVGLDFNTGKGWSGSLNYNANRSIRVNDPDSDSRSLSYTSRNSLSISGNRRLEKGFKLPFMKTPFRNQTTLRLEYTRNLDTSINSTTRRTPQENGEEALEELVWNTPQEDRSWTLRGSADFQFSTNVSGGAFYEFGSSETGTISNKTSYTEFGVNCTIQIRNSRGRRGGSGGNR